MSTDDRLDDSMLVIGPRAPRHPFHDHLVVRSKGCRSSRRRGLVAKLAFPDLEIGWLGWSIGVFSEFALFASGAAAGVGAVYLAEGRPYLAEPAVGFGSAAAVLTLAVVAKVVARVLPRSAPQPQPVRA